MRKIPLKMLIVMSFLVAINIVLVRMLPIYPTPFIRLSFGFVPIAMAGLLFGAVPAIIVAGLADVIGVLMFPSPSGYFPGLTLSAVLEGLLYGLLLYRVTDKKTLFIRILLVAILDEVFVDLLLGTFWQSVLMGRAYMALFPLRSIKILIMIAGNLIVLPLLCPQISKVYHKHSNS
ncbi:MAG: folate family ECF transporter S component [Hyphomonadaceae bacterium]|nr:folate family ECF transporter S component [Clostridia bacterium]